MVASDSPASSRTEVSLLADELERHGFTTERERGGSGLHITAGTKPAQSLRVVLVDHNDAAWYTVTRLGALGQRLCSSGGDVAERIKQILGGR